MLQEIFSGLGAYRKALRMIFQMNLWPYMLLPMLISLLLAIGVFALAWGLGDDIGGVMSGWYPWERGAETVAKIANVFGGLLVAVTGILLYKNLVLVFVGPFMSPLSEKVENALTGNTYETGFQLKKMLRDFFRGLRLALRNVIREILFTVLLLILGLIPVFSPFTTAGIFIVQSYYAGFGNFDYFLERRANVRQSIRYVQRHRGQAVGNGIVFVGLLLTVVGFLFAPVLGAIAGTISGVENEQSQ